MMKFFKFFKLNKYRVLEENKLFYPEERVFLLFWCRYYHSVDVRISVMGVELYFDNLEDELKILSKLSPHKYIVHLQESFVFGNKIYLQYEW